MTRRTAADKAAAKAKAKAEREAKAKAAADAGEPTPELDTGNDDDDDFEFVEFVEKTAPDLGSEAVDQQFDTGQLEAGQGDELKPDTKPEGGEDAGIPQEPGEHAELIAKTMADDDVIAAEEPEAIELPHRDPRCDEAGRHISRCDCTGAAREPL